MSIRQLQKEIAALPAQPRKRLIQTTLEQEIQASITKILEELEDSIDVKRHLEVLKKNSFEPWQEVQKRLHA